LHICPTASASFSRNDTPLIELSRVVTSCVVLANGPSRTVKVARACTGRRKSRRRSAAGAVTGSVAGGRTRFIFLRCEMVASLYSVRSICVCAAAPAAPPLSCRDTLPLALCFWRKPFLLCLIQFPLQRALPGFLSVSTTAPVLVFARMSASVPTYKPRARYLYPTQDPAPGLHLLPKFQCLAPTPSIRCLLFG